MKLSLLSKDTTFFELFENSARLLYETAEVFTQLIVEENFDERVNLSFKISELEHKADESTHTILRKLGSTFVTPFDRDDIYNLAHQLDDCVDFIEDASDIIELYQIKKLPKKTKKISKIILEASELTLKVMPRLEKGKEISKYWIEINSLENEADRLYRLALADLFQEEKDPIALIKSKDLVETMEKCIDAFEALAGTIETIVIEES